MMKKIPFIFHFLLIVLMLPRNSYADTELEGKLREGRGLEQRGRAMDALRIYEELYPRYPEDLRLYESLRRVYRQTRDYTRWIQLAQDQMNRNPNHPKFIESLTEAYLWAGEKEKAIEAGEKIFEVKSPQVVDYNLIGALFLTHRMPDEAIQIYLRGRKVFGDENLFASILANAYKSSRDDRGAAEEYLRMLKGDPGERNQGEIGLQQIVRKGDPKMILSVLEEALRREPHRKELYLYMGDIHLKEGRYEEALKSYERGEVLDPLYNLARRAEEEGRYEIALRSYETLAERGKSVTSSLDEPVALYRKGVTLRKMGKEEEAILTFQDLIKNYPNREERLKALYALGEIYLKSRRDPEKASFYFEEFLVQNPKVRSEGFEARFSLVECHLLNGDFKEVEKGLLNLMNTPMEDRALYQLGETHFFREDFKSALEKFNQVVEKYPKSSIENDALQRILLITDYEKDEGLRTLARVELLRRQGRFDEGINELKGFLNVEGGMSQMAPSAKRNEGLKGNAILLMGDLYEGMGDFPSSISSYQGLVERDRQSHLAPEALRRAGEVYWVRLGDRKKALETFERVLLDYPHSVQTDLIRMRMEELKEEL